ncbi:hypothetical protein F5878DRAFT_8937 [Lentinula raphanica]|uniref:Uncharacterized protein n=1 Tax=Lentinula raphanica TaxID=153919 RepID=A0AA38U4Y2_9AGAR|nr:hypothetical protein F5878DRAFT_8937 [Lentinula raphanica]
MKAIFTKLKGKLGKSGSKRRKSLETAGSGGAGIAVRSCFQLHRTYVKPSFRSTCWDLSDQVLSALNIAAQSSPVPYLATLSTVALSIFKAAQGAKENREALGELSKTACDFASSVLDTYRELHPSDSGSDTSQDQSSFSSDHVLNNHVELLLKTFKNINDWITRVKTRKLFCRLISYKSDLREIQKFRGQLRDAMDKFQLQSSIALRTYASQTERNNVTRHEQTQERLIIIQEEMQILIRRSPPTTSDSNSPSSSHANIVTPAGSDIVIESEKLVGFGAAAMSPNGLLAASILQPASTIQGIILPKDSSQPGSIEGIVSRPDAGLMSLKRCPVWYQHPRKRPRLSV